MRPPPQKKRGGAQGTAPPILAHVYCGQTVGWIKMKLGMEVGLDPGQIVLDGYPVPLTERGTAAPFSAYVCCGQTVANLSYC